MQVCPNWIAPDLYAREGERVTLDLWFDTIVHTLDASKDVAVMYNPDTRVAADVAQNAATVESMILEGWVAVPVGKENARKHGGRFTLLMAAYDDCYDRG